MNSKLHLKHDDEEEASTEPCPNCGSPMATGTVICLQCGFDRRSGKAPGDGGGKRPSPVIIAGLVLLIVAALAVVFLRSFGTEAAPIAPPVAPEPAPQAPPAQDAPQPEPAAPAVVEPAAPVATEIAVETPAAPVVEAEPVVPAIDWEAIAASHLQRLTTELDRRAPVYELGEAVELRMTNGLIHRGVYQRFAEGEILLQVTTNESRTFDVETLDRGTRVRVEPEYRQKYLEYLVRQRVAQEKAAADQKSVP